MDNFRSKDVRDEIEAIDKLIPIATSETRLAKDLFVDCFAIACQGNPLLARDVARVLLKHKQSGLTTQLSDLGKAYNAEMSYRARAAGLAVAHYVPAGAAING